jgi:hypothetical protein
MRFPVSLLAATIAVTASLNADPAWWAQRGVLDGDPADDYAYVNQGQLKHIALQAYYEINARIPIGAGAALDSTISSWLAGGAPDNYAVMNVGQLKNLAKLFYDRLDEVGYNDPPIIAGQNYPWNQTVAAQDYRYANIGQVKQVFSFDLNLDTDNDTMPNWWESSHGLNPNSAGDIYGDSDLDGITNQLEFVYNTNPNTTTAIEEITAEQDFDGDGLANASDPDPLNVDADGDGYWDSADASPWDSQVQLGPPISGDTTAPVITIIKP